jgi:hypothetical protein
VIGNLNAVDMLNVWEQGLNQSPLHRALILLVAAHPEMQADALTELSIGQRDKRLLELRERLFGSRLVNTTICPECSERIEWQNEVADIIVSSGEAELNEYDLDIDNYHIRFRLPNSIDISAAMTLTDIDKAQDELLTHCILSVEHAGQNSPISSLPKHIIETIGTRIEALDPQAEISINLQCPECSHQWDVLFDITSFLWTELNDWAERTLQLIHKLARGYGWTEREILNLSPIRRQLYSGMLG